MKQNKNSRGKILSAANLKRRFVTFGSGLLLLLVVQLVSHTLPYTLSDSMNGFENRLKTQLALHVMRVLPILAHLHIEAFVR